MDQKKREIITQAAAIYLKYGIKSVTMDEMARQLGISKKTLYTFVADKNELIEQCVLLDQQDEVCKISEIHQENENAIDEILAISRVVSSELKKVHPSIIFDLARYHPKALNIINTHKRNFIKSRVLDNLRRGIEQGLYRSDLNIEVIATLYQATIDHIMLGDLFPGSQIGHDLIYKEFFRYHIKGIASEGGLEYLQELIKNDENF